MTPPLRRRRSRRRAYSLLAALLTAAGLLYSAAAAASAPTVFRIADDRITEASGIAPGRASPGVVYVQNDSGDTNRFFALDAATGATAATVTVAGALNVDWEDIATGPGRGGRPSVWLADTGDNDGTRPEVQVYRVPEPRLPASARGRQLGTAPAEIWRLRYPAGPVDAESLAVAPDGTAYVFTKTLGSSEVYRLPGRPDAAHVQVLQRIGTVDLRPTGTANPFGLPGQLVATGAAISADGRLLVLRTYSDAYVWRLTRGDVAAALRRAPVRVALPVQPQGEGVCVQGNRLLLSSEGRHSAVLAVAVPPTQAAATPGSATISDAPAPARTAGPTTLGQGSPQTRASASPSNPAMSAHHSDRTRIWLALAALAVVAVLVAGLAALALRRRRVR